MANLEKPEVIEEEETAPEATPAKEEKYIQIRPGDTLEDFAERYGVTPEFILERNQLHPSDFRFGYWVFV